MPMCNILYALFITAKKYSNQYLPNQGPKLKIGEVLELTTTRFKSWITDSNIHDFFTLNRRYVVQLSLQLIEFSPLFRNLEIFKSIKPYWIYWILFPFLCSLFSAL